MAGNKFCKILLGSPFPLTLSPSVCGTIFFRMSRFVPFHFDFIEPRVHSITNKEIAALFDVYLQHFLSSFAIIDDAITRQWLFPRIGYRFSNWADLTIKVIKKALKVANLRSKITWLSLSSSSSLLSRYSWLAASPLTARTLPYSCQLLAEIRRRKRLLAVYCICK